MKQTGEALIKTRQGNPIDCRTPTSIHNCRKSALSGKITVNFEPMLKLKNSEC